MRGLAKYSALVILLNLPLFGQNSVLILWEPNQEPDLDGYKIYYGESPDLYNDSIYVGNSTSYRLENLTPDRHYYFAVTAIDFAGNESDFSDQVDLFLPKTEESGEEEPAPEDQSEEPKENDPEASEPTAVAKASILGEQAYNFPNPFSVRRESTVIRFEMLVPASITIEIFDANTNLVRRLVNNEFRDAGEQARDIWDGRNDEGSLVANGIYFCSIRSEKEQRIIKIATKR